MKKKKFILLIVISLLLSIGIILCPLLFIEELKDALSLGGTILSGFAAVAVLILGWFLYEDIIGKKVLDKQSDTVIAFLEELKSIQFKLIAYSDDRLIALAPLVSINKNASFVSIFLNNSNSPMDNFTVVFMLDNYYNGFANLSKLSNSIYMPLELQTQLAFIREHVMQEINPTEDKRIIKIIIESRFPNDNEETKWFKFFEPEISANAYLESLRKIVITLESWLDKNSRTKLFLNL